MRIGPVALLVTLALAAPAWAQAPPPDTATRLVGSLGVRLGVYSADRLESFSTTGDSVRQRRASDAYLVVVGTRHLWPHLALEGSLGALARGDTFVRDGSFLSRARVTIVPVSAGVRVYPVAPQSGARILPYLTAAGSLVLGVQTFETNTYEFDYRSETRVTTGALAGAGIDYRIAERMLLGLYAGYQRARFSEPLSDLPGAVSDFSGPQFLLTFSYLISGTGGGPRGEGTNGN